MFSWLFKFDNGLAKASFIGIDETENHAKKSWTRSKLAFLNDFDCAGPWPVSGEARYSPEVPNERNFKNH